MKKRMKNISDGELTEENPQDEPVAGPLNVDSDHNKSSVEARLDTMSSTLLAMKDIMGRQGLLETRPPKLQGNK